MARTLAQYASASRSRDGRPSLMSSCTGMLSTTSSASPAASMRSASATSFSFGHASPTGTSYSALTTPVTPGIWRMWVSGIGSVGPNQRKDGRILPSQLRWHPLDPSHDPEEEYRCERGHHAHHDEHRLIAEPVHHVSHQEREQHRGDAGSRAADAEHRADVLLREGVARDRVDVHDP